MCAREQRVELVAQLPARRALGLRALHVRVRERSPRLRHRHAARQNNATGHLLLLLLFRYCYCFSAAGQTHTNGQSYTTHILCSETRLLSAPLSSLCVSGSLLTHSLNQLELCPRRRRPGDCAVAWESLTSYEYELPVSSTSARVVSGSIAAARISVHRHSTRRRDVRRHEETRRDETPEKSHCAEAALQDLHSPQRFGGRTAASIQVLCCAVHIPINATMKSSIANSTLDCRHSAVKCAVKCAVKKWARKIER